MHLGPFRMANVQKFSLLTLTETRPQTDGAIFQPCIFMRLVLESVYTCITQRSFCAHIGGIQRFSCFDQIGCYSFVWTTCFIPQHCHSNNYLTSKYFKQPSIKLGPISFCAPFIGFVDHQLTKTPPKKQSPKDIGFSEPRELVYLPTNLS